MSHKTRAQMIAASIADATEQDLAELAIALGLVDDEPERLEP